MSKSIWDTRFSTSKAVTFDEALKMSGMSLDEWITMKGSHVLLGDEGEILGGLGGKFKNLSDVPRNTVKQREGESDRAFQKRAKKELGIASGKSKMTTEKNKKGELKAKKEIKATQNTKQKTEVTKKPLRQFSEYEKHLIEERNTNPKYMSDSLLREGIDYFRNNMEEAKANGDYSKAQSLNSKLFELETAKERREGKLGNPDYLPSVWHSDVRGMDDQELNKWSNYLKDTRERLEKEGRDPLYRVNSRILDFELEKDARRSDEDRMLNDNLRYGTISHWTTREEMDKTLDYFKGISRRIEREGLDNEEGRLEKWIQGKRHTYEIERFKKDGLDAEISLGSRSSINYQGRVKKICDDSIKYLNEAVKYADKHNYTDQTKEELKEKIDLWKDARKTALR